MKPSQTASAGDEIALKVWVYAGKFDLVQLVIKLCACCKIPLNFNTLRPIITPAAL